MRIPGMRKDGGYHIVVPLLLQELTILNTNTIMPLSLGQVQIALVCDPNFVGHLLSTYQCQNFLVLLMIYLVGLLAYLHVMYITCFKHRSWNGSNAHYWGMFSALKSSPAQFFALLGWKPGLNQSYFIQNSPRPQTRPLRTGSDWLGLCSDQFSTSTK